MSNNRSFEFNQAEMRGRKYEDCWVRLGIAVIKQACMDYYKDCRPFKKLPKRPYKKPNGKKGDLMNDHEYHEWLISQVKDRRARKQRLIDFFHSEWYLILSGQDDFELADKMISVIEKRRDEGLPLFDRRERLDMDDIDD